MKTRHSLRRLLALLLAALLLIALLPAAALAEGADPAEAAEPAEPTDPAPDPAAETPDPDGPQPPPPGEVAEQSEAERGPSPDDDPDDDLTPADDAVPVRFLCDPADLSLTLYDAAGAALPAPEGGCCLLEPGTYLFDAACEGYESTVGAALYVPADRGEAEITVVLERVGEPMTTRKGDGCLTEADPHLPGDADAQADAAPAGAGARVITGGKRDFRWPAPASKGLSSCFEDGRNHDALDMCGGVQGSAIVASYPGTVCEVGYAGGYGNYVMIKHSYVLADGSTKVLYSKYNHLYSYSVAKGDTVKAGAVIAGIGGTGGDYPVHLDFQILTSPAWTNYNYHNVSIDPYINELLELPEDIWVASTPSCCGVGPTGCCCKQYLDYVRDTVYARPAATGTYLDKCTWYPSLLTVTMSKSEKLMSLPCSSATSSASKTLATLAAGTELAVDGVYQNSKGNYWYHVSTADGAEGFVYCPYTTVADYREAEIQAGLGCTGKEPPETLPLGSGYSVDWVIRSEALELSAVTGRLLTGETVSSTGTAEGLLCRSYALSRTPVDLNLTFGTLAAGPHRLELTARVDNYYSLTGKVLKTKAVEKTVLAFDFVTVAPHTHSFTVVETAPGCETPGSRVESCACGYTITTELPALGHDWLDWVAVPDTARQERLCARCGASESRLREAAQLTARSLSLGGEIGLNFYLRLPESFRAQSGAAALIGGAQQPLSEGVARSYQGETLYGFTGRVAAKEMNVPLTLTLRAADGSALPLLDAAGEDVTAGGGSFSVRDYLDALCAAGGEEKLLTLAQAMSDYGSCAQAVFDFDAANRAAVRGDLAAVTAESLAAYAPVKELTGDTPLRYAGGSLLLESETCIRHYFRLDGGDLARCRFTVDGVEVTPRQEGSWWVVEIADIPARELSRRYVVEASYDGETCARVEYAALSYAWAVLSGGSDSPELRAAVQALALYARAAEAYFGA